MSQELREEERYRERARRRAADREREFARDLRRVASRPEGKRLLRRLLEEGDIFNAGWQPGEAGAYRAGCRAQALGLWRRLRESLSASVCLELLLTEPGGQGPSSGGGGGM